MSQDDRRSRYFAKAWDPVFYTDRNIKEDESFLEVMKPQLRKDSDNVSIFLWDNLDFKVDEIEDYLKIANYKTLMAGKADEVLRRAAWIDDRSCSLSTTSMDSREYHDLVTTATGLHQRLAAPRFDCEDQPDANRRLVHIQNLDPYFILALAETATFHEVSVLRDAIWNHLARQTSIRIKIPQRVRIFQMEMHIAYFSLRTRSLPRRPLGESANHSFQRQWTDLSFLLQPEGKSRKSGCEGIYESHLSFVCCGSDNKRWAAYSFVDVHPDVKEALEDLKDQISPADGVTMDPISNGLLSADLPILDPREYFLKIYDFRIAQVLSEWAPIVRKAELCIKAYQRNHSSDLSEDSLNGCHRAEDVKLTIDWNQQASVILDRFLDVLSQTIDSWEKFRATNGDIGYFDDIDTSQDSPQAGILLSLRAIEENIDKMVQYKSTVERLRKGCHESAQLLQGRLTLEANEAVRTSGRFTAFTVSIISPVTVSISYYSIPASSAPFKLEAKTFPLAIILIGMIVQLLFVAYSMRPAWWRKVSFLLRTFKKSWKATCARDRMKNCDDETEEIEMGTIEGVAEESV